MTPESQDTLRVKWRTPLTRARLSLDIWLCKCLIEHTDAP
jgi:hypothetical protein